ncbi:hypothetical protein AAZX31_12G123500 [Glycine max]
MQKQSRKKERMKAVADQNVEATDQVTDLCTVLDGLLVAVAIQSLQGIVLLSCSVSAQTLSVAKVMAVKHVGNDH